MGESSHRRALIGCVIGVLFAACESDREPDTGAPPEGIRTSPGPGSRIDESEAARIPRPGDLEFRELIERFRRDLKLENDNPEVMGRLIESCRRFAGLRAVVEQERQRETDVRIRGALGLVLSRATWTSLPYGPRKSFGEVLVAVAGRALFYEGTSTEGGLLDLTTLEWSSLPRGGLSARAHTTYATVGAEVLLWGGVDQTEYLGGGTGHTDDGVFYSIETNSWRAVPKSPLSARSNPCFTVWDRGVFLGGGWSGLVFRDVPDDGAILWRETQTWEPVEPSAHLARNLALTFYTAGRIVVWGGRGPDREPRRDGAVYEIEARRWRPIDLLIEGFVPHTATATGGMLVVFGLDREGQGADARPQGHLAFFDPTSGSWALSPGVSLPGSPWDVRIYAAADKIGIFGVRSSWSDSDLLQVPRDLFPRLLLYNTKEGRWSLSAASSRPSPEALYLRHPGRFDHEATVLIVGEGDHHRDHRIQRLERYEFEKDRWLAIPPSPFRVALPIKGTISGNNLVGWGSVEAASGIGFLVSIAPDGLPVVDGSNPYDD
jgi:hypothetical protein